MKTQKITKPAKQKNFIDLVEQMEKPAIASDANLKELYYKEQSIERLSQRKERKPNY